VGTHIIFKFQSYSLCTYLQIFGRLRKGGLGLAGAKARTSPSSKWKKEMSHEEQTE
jgi:hypothetical protein